jgi:hypothetical protein
MFGCDCGAGNAPLEDAFGGVGEADVVVVASCGDEIGVPIGGV